MGFKALLKTGFLTHTRNYFVSTLLVQAIGFFLLPILTRMMSVGEYGTLEVWRSYSTLFYSVLTFNSYVAIGRYYFEDASDFKEFCGTSLVLVFVLSIFWFIVSIFFKDSVALLLGLPIETIVFIAPTILIGTFTSWFEQIHIPKKMSRAIATRNILNSILLLIGALTTIHFLSERKFLGYIYSQMITGGIFAFYYYLVLRKYFKLAFRVAHLKYIFSYALPLLPYSLSGVLLNYFDRIMINKYFGADEAGLYSIAYTIGMLLPTFIGAINRAWMPDYYAHMANNSIDHITIKVEKIFALICLGALFLVGFGRDIGKLLVPNIYFDALEIIPAIVIGYLFFAIYTFYGWNIDYLKKTTFVSLISVISSAANIILNFWLFPIYGYKIAAYTTLASYFLMAVLAWAISKYLIKFNTAPTKKLILNFFFFLPLAIAMIFIIRIADSFLIEFALKILIFGFYCIHLLKKYSLSKA